MSGATGATDDERPERKFDQAERAQRHIANLDLVEPVAMTQTHLPQLEPPRYEQGKTLLLVGIGARYRCDNKAGIPGQWQQLLPYLGHIPNQVDQRAYGVVYNVDDSGNMEYLCGVEVKDFDRTPRQLTTMRIAPQRYAVFKHSAHIAGLPGTFAAIWTRWLPESGHEAVDAPTLEVYGPEFNSQSGEGGLEIWVPIKS